MNKPIFEWNEELGFASCVLQDNNNNVFYGSAQCHNDDEDMKSQKTGLDIAYMRAIINALRHKRDFEIKPQLAAYKQLFYSMNKSLKFNPKSYENKMLQRKIQEKQTDLDTIKEMITDKQQELKTYIKNKDIFYNKIRANRNHESRKNKIIQMPYK